MATTTEIKPGGAGFGQRRFLVRDRMFAQEPATAERRRLYEANRDRPVLVNRWPGPHSRVNPPRVGGWERFTSYETTDGYVSLGTNDADIFRFSGQPDHIEIFVLDNAAIVSFVDDAGFPQDEIRLEANNFYAPSIKANRVRGRNAAALSVARIQVVGKWDSQL